MHVGIVGAGTIGAMLAFRLATFGKEVYVYDVSARAVQHSMRLNETWVTERTGSGVLTRDEASQIVSRLHPCATLGDCVGMAELVIEAAPEKLEIKRQVFAEIDHLAPSDTVIATISSSIPCSRIADATNRPDRVLNMHFPHPADGRPVELMGSAHTARATMAACEQFVRSIGMLPIVVKREIMGFGVPRIWREIKKTALRLVADGHLEFEDIDRCWMLIYGGSGIFAVMDAIGLDVVRDIETQYYLDSRDERDKAPQLLENLIAQGRLGVKSGRGFYTYPNPEYERPGWLQKQPPWTPSMAIGLDEIT